MKKNEKKAHDFSLFRYNRGVGRRVRREDALRAIGKEKKVPTPSAGLFRSYSQQAAREKIVRTVGEIRNLINLTLRYLPPTYLTKYSVIHYHRSAFWEHPKRNR